MPIRDLVILAVILGSIPLCFFDPYIGVLMWSWISYFSPHRFGWQLAYNFPVAMAIALPTLGGILFTRRINRHFMTRESTLLLLFWAWFVLTLFHASLVTELAPHVGAAKAYLVQVSKVLLMTFVTILVVTSRKRLHYLFVVIAFSMGALAVKATLFGIRTGGRSRVWGPPESFLGDNNDFALALNMSLPLLFYLGQSEERRLLRVLYRIFFLCGIVSVILTYSRGGLLGLFVVLAALAFRSRKKILAIVLLPIFALSIIAFTPTRWTERMETFLGGELDQSARSRLNAWRFALNLTREYPLTGGGFQTFNSELFQRYAPEEDPRGYQGPHSIYFQVLGEHGYVGLILFLALLGSSWSTLRKMRVLARGDPAFRWTITYSRMLEISLIAYAISGAFLGRAYFDFYFQLIACVIILKILVKSELMMRVRPQEVSSAPIPIRERVAS